jgi:hypothetical protein
MNKPALIIFVRNPESGKVKTRLAKTIGHEKALRVYERLLEHTRDITKSLSCDKFLFYADYLTEIDDWDKNIYCKKLQEGEDLGQKMSGAFSVLFDQGYNRIIIIGSDCFELDEKKLAEAFEVMGPAEVIIGPATDGGYYLLGLQKMIPEIFENIAWSSSQVLKETVAVLKTLNVRYSLLPELNDIDEEADLTDKLILHLK